MTNLDKCEKCKYNYIRFSQFPCRDCKYGNRQLGNYFQKRLEV